MAQPCLAPPASQSERDATVVLTPRVAEVASPSAAPTARLAPQRLRVRRSAVLVAYRRRSATGAVRLATGLGTVPPGR